MGNSFSKDVGRTSGISRRRFLQLSGGGLVSLAVGTRPAFAASYRVGVGKDANPYAATIRAVEASGEWPSLRIQNRTVVIKPNLVMPMASDTGATTDPEVVRAMVDMSLEAGAAHVSIVEGGFNGANFSACGYGFFGTYDPRVTLIDLNDEPIVFVSIPGGLAYNEMYLPEMLLNDDVVFMSAAKLKTHSHTLATLSMKNLIGLAPNDNYRLPPEGARVALHRRGISQAVVDLNSVRPVDYAVVDGVWGMEGNGPIAGRPVRMDIVVAGSNSVAVDRACLKATSLPQGGVKHLSYASRKGQGPRSMDEIQVVGDSFPQGIFRRPQNLPPHLEYPKVFPKEFVPISGQDVRILYWIFPLKCWRRVDIVRESDLSPEITHIRALREWGQVVPGFEMLRWDGKDDDGVIVPPDSYFVRVIARYSDTGVEAYASGRVTVTS